MRYASLPKEISREDAKEIIRRLKKYSSLSGDKDALIQGHMRLIWNIARKTYRAGDFLDLFQTGCLSLVDTVNRIFNYRIEMKDENVWLVIQHNAWERCKEHVEYQRAVRKPGRTIRHQLVKGLNKEGTIIEQFDDLPIEAKVILRLLPPVYQGDMIEIARKVPLDELKRLVLNKLYPIVKIPVVQSYDQKDDQKDDQPSKLTPIAKKPIDPALLDCIEKAIDTYREAEIIDLRAKGYTYQEIGDQFYMSAMQIGNYVNKVEQKFSLLYDEKKPKRTSQ